MKMNNLEFNLYQHAIEMIKEGNYLGAKENLDFMKEMIQQGRKISKHPEQSFTLRVLALHAQEIEKQLASAMCVK